MTEDKIYPMENRTINIYGLAEADTYICKLDSFEKKHPTLIIEARNINKQELLHVYFVDVRYIESPLSWSGANVSIGNSEESILLWRRLETSVQEKGIVYLATSLYKLYIIKTPTTPTRVIAADTFALRLA